MEALFTYFLKANGLLVTFFLAYYFSLRKETFFNKNRWFLLLGLFASVLLPLITFTKTIWVEPNPIVYETVSNDFVPYIIENKVIEEPIDWNSILFYVYFQKGSTEFRYQELVAINLPLLFYIEFN